MYIRYRTDNDRIIAANNFELADDGEALHAIAQVAGDADKYPWPQPHIGQHVWRGGKIVGDATGAFRATSKMSSRAFMDRFTDAELEAIEATMEAPTSAARKLRMWLRRMGAARDIDLTSPRTAAAMAALVARNVISAARRDTILTP